MRRFRKYSKKNSKRSGRSRYSRKQRGGKTPEELQNDLSFLINAHKDLRFKVHTIQYQCQSLFPALRQYIKELNSMSYDFRNHIENIEIIDTECNELEREMDNVSKYINTNGLTVFEQNNPFERPFAPAAPFAPAPKRAMEILPAPKGVAEILPAPKQTIDVLPAPKGIADILPAPKGIADILPAPKRELAILPNQ